MSKIHSNLKESGKDLIRNLNAYQQAMVRVEVEDGICIKGEIINSLRYVVDSVHFANNTESIYCIFCRLSGRSTRILVVTQKKTFKSSVLRKGNCSIPSRYI